MQRDADRDFRLHSALDAVGDTPLVRLSRMFNSTDGEVLAKLDYLNPGLSRDDRVARQLLQDARRSHFLTQHQTVIGGNVDGCRLGVALACAVWGHPHLTIVPDSTPLDQQATYEALGCEVLLVPAGENEVENRERVALRAKQLAQETGAFLADPFLDTSYFRAHRLHTATEILRQTGGLFDGFCDTPRSGGTFSGCSAAFKEYSRGIQCFVTDFDSSGKGRGTDSPLLDWSLVAGTLPITAEEAQAEVQELARREGLLVAAESGATLAGARQLLRGKLRGRRIVVVLGDTSLPAFGRCKAA